MKNITLSAQPELIDDLRSYAAQNGTTVNELFREWSEAYVARKRRKQSEKFIKDFRETRKRIVFTSERKYTREEMNER